jgi:hypothetical protein
MENNKLKSLGRFYGEPINDFTSFEFEQFERFVGGQLTIGSTAAVSEMSGGYYFDLVSLPLEESAIFYYTPPGVTGINYRESSLRGRVKFGKLFNLTKTTNRLTKRVVLAVQDNSSIASLADHTSEFNNCKTPLIYYVNGAKPFYNTDNPDNQGNLYLVGVKPIIFYGAMGEGSLEIQTKLFDDQPLDLAALCTVRNKVLPPTNPVYLTDRSLETPQFKGKDNYYAKSFDPPENIVSNSEPEFLSWPQFFKNFWKTLTLTLVTQTFTIKQVVQETGKFYRFVIINSGTSRAKVTLLKNTVALEEFQNLELGAGTKIIKNLSNPIVLENGLNFSLTGEVLEGTETSLQVMLFYR